MSERAHARTHETRDSDSLLFSFCRVFVATKQRYREEPCLNSHYWPTKAALILKIAALPGQNTIRIQAKKKKKSKPHKLACVVSSLLPSGAFIHPCCLFFFPISRTVCGGGGADHLHRGSLPVRPEEGLPPRDLHRRGVLHQLSPGTGNGDESECAHLGPPRPPRHRSGTSFHPRRPPAAL